MRGEIEYPIFFSELSLIGPFMSKKILAREIRASFELTNDVGIRW